MAWTPPPAIARLLAELDDAVAPIRALRELLSREIPRLATMQIDEDAACMLTVLDHHRPDAERTAALEMLATRLGPVIPYPRRRVLLAALRRSGYLSREGPRALERQMLAALTEAIHAVATLTPGEVRERNLLRKETARGVSADLLGADRHRRAVSVDTQLLARLTAAQEQEAAPPPHRGEAELVAQVATRRARLTPREREVLALWRAGRSDAAIGRKLGIALATVRVLRARIAQKLRAETDRA
jgi:DNA-binding CsgD family transcriptional regulator